WRGPCGSLRGMAAQARAVQVERASRRQLELLDETAAAPVSVRETPVTPSRTERSAHKQASARERKLPRLAVRPAEAAEMLGVSRVYWEDHFTGVGRAVGGGRRILVAVAELGRWLPRNAARRGAPAGV